MGKRLEILSRVADQGFVVVIPQLEKMVTHCPRNPRQGFRHAVDAFRKQGLPFSGITLFTALAHNQPHPQREYCHQHQQRTGDDAQSELEYQRQQGVVRQPESGHPAVGYRR